MRSTWFRKGRETSYCYILLHWLNVKLCINNMIKNFCTDVQLCWRRAKLSCKLVYLTSNFPHLKAKQGPVLHSSDFCTPKLYAKISFLWLLFDIDVNQNQVEGMKTNETNIFKWTTENTLIFIDLILRIITLDVEWRHRVF